MAEVLGYANTADAIAKHCKATNTIAIRDGKRGNPNQTIIPERDLYRLVMRSHLPSAERFEEWVVAEVLPSIRKTGAYVMPGAQPATAGADSKLVGELAVMECYTRLLRPAPSSQIYYMLAKIGDRHGLYTGFLPAYAVDAAPDSTAGSFMPTKALSVLLKERGIPMGVAAFNLLLLALVRSPSTRTRIRATPSTRPRTTCSTLTW
ncbi:BRO-N domain-containing protein [Azotobacter salinestris]|uniref:BRO-N domain-containing protein n=1 Tax=Azotobacter salinestris TaxID=69964 RepID=UPI00313777FE